MNLLTGKPPKGLWVVKEMEAKYIIKVDCTATSGAVPIGAYYIAGRKAPDRTRQNPERTGFSIRVVETAEVVVTTASKTSVVQTFGFLHLLAKVEGRSANLPGAVFGIYRASGNRKIAEIVSGVDGTAVHELAPGRYHLRSIQAPIGLHLAASIIPFSIRSNETTKVDVLYYYNVMARGPISCADNYKNKPGAFLLSA